LVPRNDADTLQAQFDHVISAGEAKPPTAADRLEGPRQDKFAITSAVAAGKPDCSFL
jgi:hypothetical protein